MTTPNLTWATELSLACAIALANPATAQITYVDADAATNTTLADGTAYTPTTTLGGSGFDNEWLLRGFGNGGTVLTSHDEGGSNEDAPMLRVRLTNLIPGLEYNLYSYWWSDGGSWRGRSVTSTTQPAPQLQGYNTVHFSSSSFLPMQPLAATAIVGANQVTLDLLPDANNFEVEGHFDAPGSVLIAEGNRTMYELVLGTAIADPNGEIDIYVDDLEGPQGNGNRCWFDGVGYEWAPLTYGSSCGIGSIGMTGVPHRKTNWSVDLAASDPNSLSVLILGLNAINPIDVGTLGFTPGCFLNINIDVLELAITDGSGNASYLNSFTSLPTTTPIPVFFQWATFDSNFTLLSMTSALQADFHY